MQAQTLAARLNSALRGLFASHAQSAFNTAIVLSIVMRDARVVEALEALARSLGAAMGVPGSCSFLKSYLKATQTPPKRASLAHLMSHLRSHHPQTAPFP